MAVAERKTELRGLRRTPAEQEAEKAVSIPTLESTGKHILTPQEIANAFEQAFHVGLKDCEMPLSSHPAGGNGVFFRLGTVLEIISFNEDYKTYYADQEFFTNFGLIDAVTPDGTRLNNFNHDLDEDRKTLLRLSGLYKKKEHIQPIIINKPTYDALKQAVQAYRQQKS